MLSFAKVLSKFNTFAAVSSVAVSGRCGVACYSNNPVAIVTGAAQGIGYIISDRLLQSGYNVFLADINEDKGKQSVEELSKKHGTAKATFTLCDVTSEDSFRDTFLKAKDQGQISLLVNNAGLVDEYDAKRAVEVNLVGTIIGCQLALRFMSTKTRGKGGDVINIGSIPSFLPYPNAPIYVATKHGVVGLTRSYGDKSHFEQNGVIFSALCPSYVNTPLLYTAKPLHVLDRTPDMKYLESERVADGLSKLLSDRRNGSVLLVLDDKMEYVEIPDEIKNIPFEH